MSTLTTTQPVIEYPDDDGLPMSDNTAKFRWILLMQGNLEGEYRNRPDVFVAGNNLIYPVEGDPQTRFAPDVYVAFGRPKHDRGSYKVWEEDGIFPQVIFEVWSPSNRHQQMEDKRAFYEKYGAEEYYILYPEFPPHVEIWRREADKLVRVEHFADWVSPRLGLRFAVVNGELSAYGPTGRKFLPAGELAQEFQAAEQRAEVAQQQAEQERLRGQQERLRAEQERLRAEEALQHAEQERLRAEQERLRAEQAQQHAEQERLRAEQERLRAEEALQHAEQERLRAEEAQQHAEQERLRAEQERLRAEKLAALLRELGVDPNSP